MNNTLNQIKNTILAENNIFGSNGSVFDNNYDFISSGVSDRYVNQFYIRIIKTGPNKYRVLYNQNIQEISYTARIVVQVKDTIPKDNAIRSILAQIAGFKNVKIETFSDDTYGIYLAEYGKSDVLRGYNLVSVDFTVMEERVISSMHCEYLCLENC